MSRVIESPFWLHRTIPVWWSSPVLTMRPRSQTSGFHPWVRSLVLLTACGRAGAEGSGGRPAGGLGQQPAWSEEEGGCRPEGSGTLQREQAPARRGRSCSWGSLRTAMERRRRGTAPARWGCSGCRRSCSPGRGAWAPTPWGWAGTAAPGWAARRPGGKHTAGPACAHRGRRVTKRRKRLSRKPTQGGADKTWKTWMN